MLNDLEQLEENYTDVGNGMLAIDNYDIKKIKIILDNARVEKFDRTIFLDELKKRMQENVSKVSYEIWFDKISIDELTSNSIVFKVPSVSIIAKNYGAKFASTVNELADKFLEAPQGRSNF